MEATENLRTGQRSFTVADDSGHEHAYTHTLHGARDGFRLLLRLSKVLGPSLGELIAAGGGMEGEVGYDRVGAAVQAAAAALLSDQEMVEQLLRHTFRDGERLDGHRFDLAYQANYGELLVAMRRVIADNFGDALKRLGVPFDAAVPAAGVGSDRKSAKPSPGSPKKAASSG